MTMSSNFAGKVIIATCVSVLVLFAYTSAWRILTLSYRHPQSFHQVSLTEFYRIKKSLTISLYYESLCPGCEGFIVDQLCPLWEKMGDYFKVELLPYGNAETIVSKTGEISFKCQHGPPECTANFIHACALKHLSYKDSVKFICCMEGNQNVPGSGEYCAEELSIDYSPINTCANGPEGVQLHSQFGKQTDDLKPSHEFVPWILFNGVSNIDEMHKSRHDLLKIVCKYIKGTKPKECKSAY